ncbi:MAG: TspO/MBR family protein [Pseudomonadota bacterium]
MGQRSVANGKTVIAFVAFYALCFIVQSIGAYVTQLSVHDWYPALAKSSLTPPGMVFGIAWTILYLVMAGAATCIYRARGTWRSRSLAWWLIQLLLGLMWSLVFFGQRAIDLGFIIILLNWVAVAFTTYRFFRIERMAGWLMVPLLLWLSFACYLNGFILTHN